MAETGTLDGDRQKAGAERAHELRAPARPAAGQQHTAGGRQAAKPAGAGGQQLEAERTGDSLDAEDGEGRTGGRGKLGGHGDLLKPGTRPGALGKQAILWH